MQADSLRLLQDTLSSQPEGTASHRFQDVLAAMYDVLATSPDWRAERVLLDVVRVRHELPFATGSEFPHSLSPEDMLKSLAIQALTKWTGLIHLREICLVEAITPSARLRSIIQNAIQRAQKSAQPTSEPDDFVIESESVVAEHGEDPVAWSGTPRPPKPVTQEHTCGRQRFVKHTTITIHDGRALNSRIRSRRKMRYSFDADIPEGVPA